MSQMCWYADVPMKNSANKIRIAKAGMKMRKTKRNWTPIKKYSEILFEYYEGIAKITINREPLSQCVYASDKYWNDRAMDIVANARKSEWWFSRGRRQAFAAEVTKNVKGMAASRQAECRVWMCGFAKRIRSLPTQWLQW